MVSVQDRELFKVALLVILDTDLILNPADEAFASKYMPDLGYDMKDFKVFSWRLNNWNKLDKRLTSPVFECGGQDHFSMFQLGFRSLERHPSR